MLRGDHLAPDAIRHGRGDIESSVGDTGSPDQCRRPPEPAPGLAAHRRRDSHSHPLHDQARPSLGGDSCDQARHRVYRGDPLMHDSRSTAPRPSATPWRSGAHIR